MIRAAEERGVDTTDLLREAGLTRAFLQDPDSRIAGSKVLSLWNALRERTSDPALQLDAPSSLPFGAYRAIDYLVASSATVGDGISRFARFFGLIAESVRLRVVESETGYSLVLDAEGGRAVPPLYVDYVFAALVGRIRMKIKPNLALERVDLRQPEPPAAARYVECFGAPVRFGAASDSLCFASREWRTPLESADEALARLLEDHARILAERIPQTSSDFAVEVQNTIATSLPEGGSAPVIANALNVSVRTLQRRLVAAGTTFSEVFRAVRHQLAEEYLTDPKVSIAEAAFLLGFSDQSSFHRAFRRWTGESPGHWRKRRT